MGYKSPLIIFPKQDPDDKKKGYRLNAQRYVDLCIKPQLKALMKKAPNGLQRILMQDGAKCHSAKYTKEYITGFGILLMEGYPASSPDCNPIECLWAELNRRISLKHPETDDELMEAAYDVWASFTQDEIDAFVGNFRSACAEVVRKKGL